jgi:hypothetical protein
VVQKSGNGTAPGEGTLLGVVFAFDVESLGPEYAFTRAWQLWMERLEAGELHRAALYDGALSLPGLPLITVIAISAAAPTIAYVREAFAAPDLAAFQGIAPLSHRFLDAPQLPRERLVLRGYVSDDGQFRPMQEDIPLRAIASHAGWPLEGAKPEPAIETLVTTDLPATRGDPTSQATHMIHAAPPIEGATHVMMRLWKPTFRPDPASDQRRRLAAIIGAVIVLLALAIVATRVSAGIAGRQALPTATLPGTTPGALVVAPLTLRLPCVPGQLTQFTINDNGPARLIWASNAATFEPPLSFSDVSGTLAPGDAQVVTVTTSETITDAHTTQLQLTSDNGSATITLIFGGCPHTP